MGRTRSRSAAATIAFVAAAALAVGPGRIGAAPAAGSSQALLAAALARYANAVTDAGAADVAHVETQGTLAGAGLTGAFHSWSQADSERTDENLGPRADTTLRIGDRYWNSDANGDVRELTGVLLRRARTQHFIDSGDFAKAPQGCVYRGRTRIGPLEADVVEVAADGGETETLYLDAQSGLPDRLAYDDDDGRTTIDFSDWRGVGGHHFPFKSVVSNGDHAFDTTQTTTSISYPGSIPPQTFAALVPRRISMPAPQTLGLTVSEGHLYAPVTIAGRRFNFLLDTGAQDIVLDKHVAASLGLAPLGAFEASGAARTGGLQIVKIDELDIGNGKLTDLIASTIDLGASTQGAFRIDGVLGYPFFASATVRIDYFAKTMTFGVPGTLDPLGEKIGIVVDRSFPEATLRLDGTTDAPFIIDTGNAGEVLLYKPFLDKHAGIVPFSTSGRHSYGIGGSTASYRTSLDRIEFGTIPMYHAETDVMLATSGAFADRFDAGNVGLGLLKNFVVTFDVTDAAMYLQRSQAFDDGRTRI